MNVLSSENRFHFLLVNWFPQLRSFLRLFLSLPPIHMITLATFRQTVTSFPVTSFLVCFLPPPLASLRFLSVPPPCASF
jgi:hypothetical protein